MKYRYTKFTGDLLDGLDLEDLVARLSDLLLSSGFGNPYAMNDDERTLQALQDAAAQAASLGLAVHAGHGLTVANVGPVAAIPEVEELNIGHTIVSNAVYVGLPGAVRAIRAAMDAGRGRMA